MGAGYYDALLPVREPGASLPGVAGGIRPPCRVLASVGVPAGRIVLAFVSDSARLSACSRLTGRWPGLASPNARSPPDSGGRCGRWRRSWRTRGTRVGRQVWNRQRTTSTWSTRPTPGWGTARCSGEPARRVGELRPPCSPGDHQRGRVHRCPGRHRPARNTRRRGGTCWPGCWPAGGAGGTWSRPGPTASCYDKKITEGKTPEEALRALKRQISDAIYKHLRADAARAAASIQGPGGHTGNDSVASAAGSHPERQLFGQATPGPQPTLRPVPDEQTGKPSSTASIKMPRTT